MSYLNPFTRKITYGTLIHPQTLEVVPIIAVIVGEEVSPLFLVLEERLYLDQDKEVSHFRAIGDDGEEYEIYAKDLLTLKPGQLKGGTSMEKYTAPLGWRWYQKRLRMEIKGVLC